MFDRGDQSQGGRLYSLKGAMMGSGARFLGPYYLCHFVLILSYPLARLYAVSLAETWCRAHALSSNFWLN